MFMLKSANNTDFRIEVSFFRTYEEAFAKMEEEAKSSITLSDGELQMDSFAASVSTTDGNVYYWGIEIANIPEESKPEEICCYTLSKDDVREAMLFYGLEENEDFIDWATEKAKKEFSVNEQEENERFYNFIQNLFGLTTHLAVALKGQ